MEGPLVRHSTAVISHAPPRPCNNTQTRNSSLDLINHDQLQSEAIYLIEWESIFIIITFKFMHPIELRSALLHQFPEFSSKETLQPYFYSFDFPEKQQAQLKWWEIIIEFLIKYSRSTFITYVKLQQTVSFYDFKLAFLPKIISELNRISVIHSTESKIIAPSSSWFNKLLSFNLSTPEPVSSLEPSSKLFSVKESAILHREICNNLATLFLEYSALPFELFLKNAEKITNFEPESIKEAVSQIKFLLLSKEMIYYNPIVEKLNTPEWVEIEYAKALLKQQEESLEQRIEAYQSKLHALKSDAKAKIFEDKAMSKIEVQKILQIKQTIIALDNHRRLLCNKRHDLEMNVITEQTVKLAKKVDGVIKATLIDTAELEQLAQDQAEIRFRNKENEALFEEMAQQDENEVESLMKEIKQEMQINNNNTANNHKYESRELYTN